MKFGRMLQHIINVDADDDFEEAVRAANDARDKRCWRDAVQSYRRALEVRPNALHLAVQLGHASKERGDYLEAQNAYDSFAAIYPDDADIYLQLGHLAKIQGKATVAADYYRKALSLDLPGGVVFREAKRELEAVGAGIEHSRRQLALALTDSKRFDEAFDLLTQLVEDGAEDLVGLLGNVCKEIGRFRESMLWYDRYSILTHSGSPDQKFDCEVQIGHLKKVQGDSASALSHYISARKLLSGARTSKCSDENILEEIRSTLQEITSSLRI